MKKLFLMFTASLFVSSCAVNNSVVTETKPDGTTVQVPVEVKSIPPVKYDVRNKNMKIGAVLPLSGDSADSGLKVKNGIELAISTFNKENNSERTSIYQDTEAGDAALEEFYRTSSSDPLIAGIVGPVQNSQLAKVKALAENYRVVTVSPTAAALTKDNTSRYFFSDAVFPEDEGRVMAEFTVNTLKKKIMEQLK